MRRSSILLTMAAVAAVTLGPLSASAREHSAHPARAANAASMSQRTAAAHAESDRGSGAGQDSRRHRGSGLPCRLNGTVMLDDGQMHACP
jgi:hypothetical protein